MVTVASTVGWFRINPFEQKHTVRAEFAQVSNLAVRSPVRIAGVEVGKVSKVEPRKAGGARVTMELKPSALPLHQDARLKVRSRIFLEGNFFVDLQPGTPASPELGDDDVIPARQTSAPVLLGDVLTTLQRDTRTDLQTLLRELSTGLGGGAAESLNRSAPDAAPALRDLAVASDATLGQQPDRGHPARPARHRPLHRRAVRGRGGAEGRGHEPGRHGRSAGLAGPARCRRRSPRCGTRCGPRARR